MKVICIADTHGRWESVNVPDGDLLIHAGDITAYGRLDELERFNAWLGSLPHPHKIAIAGNHDWALQEEPEKAQAVLTNCHYLQDSEVTIDGIRIYGSPWTPKFFDWAFMLHRDGEELRQKWDQIPQGIDILVTHGPPAGKLDFVPDRREYVGCSILRDVIADRKPRHHVFGHIHCCPGTAFNEHTVFANATTCNSAYEPVNRPMQFGITPRESENNLLTT